ncbi:mechanosensitive ion channel domain-containing protein [Microbulbifer yueqingensis]|uniref:Mechanosensitive ion channel n=1 Tax=Microbulbifer yueqingensis TaxID=658219 RepID=A0A1G9CLT8_9GAMM|nr:mechanosensitive ion channel domain-containing protein [Microbulbifer yueqingensis]SDK52660.1 Mechanosensitive ion channel [Microbulbifer yueqingensis]
MVGDPALSRPYIPGGGASLAPRRTCIFILLLLLLLACEALAQLPGTKKPKEFEPVIPEFDAPSADWWTGWPDATREQREQWLGELEEAWRERREKLPDSESVRELVKNIDTAFEDIDNTWQRFREYQKIRVLPGIEYPQNPTVLQWAAADAIIARAQQQLASMKLEAEKLDETLARSLEELRQQVVIMREQGDDEAGAQIVALKLFLAQVRHLDVIERRATIGEQVDTWQEKIELAGQQLDQMLATLTYSATAGKKLQEDIEQKEQQIGEITGREDKLAETRFRSADASLRMERELKLMELRLSAMAQRLQMRKLEQLQAMNRALAPEDEEARLVASRELVEDARELADKTLRELNVRQRQVVGWVTEDSDAMRRWWKAFEQVSSAVTRVDELVEDVLRYQRAQLNVFQQRKGWWATLRERTGHLGNQLVSGWRNLANYQLFSIAENPVTLRLVAKIALVLIGAFMVSGLMRRFLNRLVAREKASESSMYNLGRVLHYSIIGIALLATLVMLGLDTTKLALVAGALSVGIGFGLQAIFSNFISGLILLFEQPLRVGDLVELESGVFGRIRDINVRSTRITTRDNIDILVPNSEFVAGRVINHTLDDPVRRIHIPFGVAYGSDPDAVREAAMEAAERVSITHTDWRRKTEVWLMEFGDSALNFKLVVWINSNMVSPLDDPYALYNLELLREFNQRGIEVPFPQRDIHVRSWEPRVPLERPEKE